MYVYYACIYLPATYFTIMSLQPGALSNYSVKTVDHKTHYARKKGIFNLK